MGLPKRPTHGTAGRVKVGSFAPSDTLPTPAIASRDLGISFDVGTSIYRSLGVSTLLEFYRKRKIPVTELEKTEGDFEQTGARGDTPLWTPRIASTEEEVIHRNEALMLFVWHFRDFFWRFGQAELGLTEKEAKAATKVTTEQSKALKICGFFANTTKHGKLDHFSEYPAFKKTPPVLGRVLVDYFAPSGKIAYATDLAGLIGHQCSEQLDFAQTVEIDNFEPDWDTRRAAEEAAWDWINLLKSYGRDLGVSRPIVTEEGVHVDFIGIGTSPKAIEARQVKLPEWIQCSPVSQEDFDRPVIWTGLFSLPPAWLPGPAEACRFE